MGKTTLFSLLLLGFASCFAPVFLNGQPPFEIPKIAKPSPFVEGQPPRATDKRPRVKVDLIRLLAEPGKKGHEPDDITGWSESERFLLSPAPRFHVNFRVSKDETYIGEDLLIWTSIDFLVAPPRAQFEQMTPDELNLAVSWGQVTQMHDLRSRTLFLEPGQSRFVRIGSFDLTEVMAAFQPDDPAPLWPWLVRMNIYVQDRDGKEIGSAYKILPLRPCKSRIKDR